MSTRLGTDPLFANIPHSFYAEGHALGVADGETAGRTEGRIFGLEKGFEKFLEVGRLQGRCAVWSARSELPTGAPTRIENTRARKNIQALALLLTNPPFKNDEESVEEVEETLKRGRAKVKVLERMLGEKENVGENVREDDGTGEQNIEDLGRNTKTIADP